MDRVLLKSFSKINIGLKVFNRRQDGYHNIHTVFQEIDFHDRIILKKKNLDALLLLMLIGLVIMNPIYV